MAIDISDIELSNVDLKKGVKLPTELSEDLAYLCGVLTGDGNISFREKKKSCVITCLGNLKDEKDFYDRIIIPLFKSIFNINLIPKAFTRDNTYGVQIHSRSIGRLFNRLGIPSGNKSGIIEIPNIFQESEKLTKLFITGLADADFCLTLKKRYTDTQYYPVVVGASKSKKIMEQVTYYLNVWGLSVCKDFDRPKLDKRFNKYTTTHMIYLYGHEQLVKWMHIIGFKNPKNLQRFELWKIRNKENPRAKEAFKILIAGTGVSEVRPHLNSPVAT